MDVQQAGPVMIDVAGHALTEEEREVLRHPLVGGVILFSRNYASPAQLAALCADIHALREPPLLIAVDHEGGRVQRFRQGFTLLPAMARLGALWEKDPKGAREAAESLGWVLGGELRAHGVDLSFAPVLDLDYGASSVIGDRALHSDPETVADLAAALLQGLGRAGMWGVGKHFPGHGFVAADSHRDLPVDPRPFEEIRDRDLVPFRRLADRLGGVMPAHVRYERCDPQPAGYSRLWLQQVLRECLGFDGVVFTDDLCMEGAACAGGIVDRANAARAAGCDMVLVCNASARARELLGVWAPEPDAASSVRISRLQPHTPAIPLAELEQDPDFRQARERVAAVPAQPVRGGGGAD